MNHTSQDRRAASTAGISPSRVAGRPGWRVPLVGGGVRG